MAYKEILLVLITFFNTLLLITGISSVIAYFHYELCNGSFCYAIKTFTTFYETTFFYYGLLLTGFCLFGLIALFSDIKALLDSYAKLLVFLLVVLIIIFVMGIWGKGSLYLYSNLWTSFKSYGSGSCRLDFSIDQLQRTFKCCGIGSTKDWTLLQRHFKTNITIPPLSCCRTVPFYELLNKIPCRDVYNNGCFTPLHNYTLPFFNTIILMGIFIGVGLIVTISCVFRYVDLKSQETELTQLQQNIINNQHNQPTVQAMPLILAQDSFYRKEFEDSTVV